MRMTELPCLIESQKTLNHRLFYKIGDIHQLITLSNSENSSFSDNNRGTVNEASRAELHGLTPPMQCVRSRRWRKRAGNQRVVESTEKEVARLINEDKRAARSESRCLCTCNADFRRMVTINEPEEELAESLEDIGGNNEISDDEDDASSVDSEMAAELESEMNKAFADMDDEDEEEEDEVDLNGANLLTAEGTSEIEKLALERGEEAVDEDEEDEIPENEDDEDDESLTLLKEQHQEIAEEINDLNEKLHEKQQQVKKSVNPIMKRRFEEIVSKLQNELQIKQRQSVAISEQISAYF